MTPCVSVALAAYNGERFLPAQTASILRQLGPADELVISLDPSSDGSRTICENLSAADSRIVLLDGPGRGVIANFENALSRTAGEFVFLSDQDDVWLDGKVSACLTALRDCDALLVMHNAKLTDGELRPLGKTALNGRFHSGAAANLLRNRYQGCCMAFRRELLDAALPFPENLPMHDQWLGLIAQKRGRVAYISRPLILYRRHADTTTGRTRAGMVQKLRWRCAVAGDYFRFLGRGRRHG